MRNTIVNKRARWMALSCCLAVATAIALSGGPKAWAFALDDQLTNGTSFPRDDLEDAARWTNRPGSLAADGTRGLGGGVEYAIAADFCDQLRPIFIDEPKPDCDIIRDAIRDVFAQWSDAHPTLTFTDVTGKIEPKLPPRSTREARRGYGAEIDLFAQVPAGFPRPGPFGAETKFYFVQADPVATNGQPVPGNTLTSADIVINPTKCFYMDPVMARSTCNHFPSLVRQQIGRSLGLGEPDRNPKRNWDNDSNPHNPVIIDCKDPMRGLRLSRRIDNNAAMKSGQGLAQRAVPKLTYDDIGGRDFLYPVCGGG